MTREKSSDFWILLSKFDIEYRHSAVADAPEEVLRTLGDAFAVHDKADFEAGDVNASTYEALFLVAGVPGKEQVSFVSEAVDGTVRLEDIVVAGDSTFVVVDEMPETGIIDSLVAEFRLVCHGFSDCLDVFIGTVHVVVQVVLVQKPVAVGVDDDVA